MKGLVLAGGYGTRLRPLTYSQQKQLIPIANKPVLFYTIEYLIEGGIKEIGIITGPNEDQVKTAIKSREWDAKISFIHQGEPKGIAHAIAIAKDFLQDDNFVVYLGDNILKEGITRHIEYFLKNKYDASVLLCEVPNPQQFGVAEIDKKGKIIRLVEKPKEPPSNLALAGIYFFTPIIHKAIKHITPSWRGELEITDAIQWLIDKGYKVGWTKVKGWWKDTGKAEDLLEANRLLLDDIKEHIESKSKIKGKIIGRVNIDKGTEIDKSTVIKGPTIIGKNTKIKNSYIGPYTSIGDNCIIENTEIEDSIIMDGTEIKDAGRIIESVIGRDVKILKNHRYPKGKKMIVGDRSEIYV